jgi:hypothetical protein
MQHQEITFAEIVRRLQEVPVDRLPLVYEFILRQALLAEDGNALNCAIASEAILAEDWDTPEEDAAWANL